MQYIVSRLTFKERSEKRGVISKSRDLGFPTVVTSFEVVMKDKRYLSVCIQLCWAGSHTNRTSLGSISLSMRWIIALRLLILTGSSNQEFQLSTSPRSQNLPELQPTPLDWHALASTSHSRPLSFMQNNLAELWSLLNFLLPDIFDDLDSFQVYFFPLPFSVNRDGSSFLLKGTVCSRRRRSNRSSLSCILCSSHSSSVA
jgi:hypothetical protein